MGRNDYNKIKQNRIDRLTGRAEKKAAASDAAYNASKRLADQIPFGQPILVGHHSEKRARRDADRIGNYATKSVELDREAKSLAARAAAAESNCTISSDDPDAIEALREKLAKLEEVQEMMKAANKIIQRKPKNEATSEKIEKLVALGFKEATAVKLFEGARWEIGFQGFQLSNNNAKINATKKRIEELERAGSIEYSRKEYEGFAVIVDPDLNRIQIDFESVAIYRELCERTGLNMRRYGFVFSRRDGNCWQRKITGNASYAARQVIRLLTGNDA
ncbi:MAG: DUF3560 domain-containing protein [Chlorobiaceae bacterium]|nr:DUF3560 domain-containing protein [Chlorobiaceae bacterium]